MREAVDSREAVQRVVRDHAGWVFAAARRRVGDAALAEDVTQAVFLLYWRKGGGITHEGKRAGWLYRAVRYCAANALRLQRIRQRHEREAAMEKQREGRLAGWGEVEAELEVAVERLSEQDRQVVVLRFYRSLSLKQVGEAMGLGEEAARKRVERAVGKLREKLVAKGVEAETVGLSGLLLAHAGEGGVEGLVERVMAGMGSGMAGGIAKGAGRAMARTKMKVAGAIALVAMAIGIPVVYVAGGEERPEVAALAGPAMREVTVMQNAAPNLEEVIGAIERQERLLQNAHIEGFEKTFYRKAKIEDEWVKSRSLSRGDAWFTGAPDGKVRINYASLIAPWVGGTADYAESRKDVAFDGKVMYEVRHMGGPAGGMTPDRLAMIRSERSPMLDPQLSGYETGVAFTLWFAPYPQSKGHTKAIRRAIAAGAKLQVTRAQLDGVEVVRIVHGDEKASLFQACYDPQRGYALRLEEWRSFDEKGQLQAYEKREVTELAEAGPGLWFPTAAELVRFQQHTRDWLRIGWRAQRVEANRPDFDEKVFVPEYPARYRVEDTRNETPSRARQQAREFREGKSGGLEPEKLARAKEMHDLGQVCGLWASEHRRRWPSSLEEMRGYEQAKTADPKAWDRWVYYSLGTGGDQNRAVLFEKTPAFAGGELVVFADGFVEFVRDRDRLTGLREDAERRVEDGGR